MNQTYGTHPSFSIAPAKAGVQGRIRSARPWVPAFAGMTTIVRGYICQKRTTRLSIWKDILQALSCRSTSASTGGTLAGSRV